MNETHQNLIRIGTDILSASRNELYLSMRFLDLALSGLRYEMNLSSLYVGTDGEKILFNPRYLVQRYLSDRVLVNRAYLHMVLHCLFRHPFHLNHRDEELWHLACDIAVEAIVDSLSVKAVRLVVSDKRNEMYDMLRRELKVLSAEGIYRVLEEKKLSLQEFGKLQLEFWVDDHVFWEHQQDDEDENSKDGETKIIATTNSRSRRSRTKNSSSWRKNGRKSGKRPKPTSKPSLRIWGRRQASFCNI